MAPLEPNDPQEIGGYRLLGRLGAGGMGLVYLGRSRAGLTVAIKVVHEQFAAEPGFRARFRREVSTARAVSGAFTAPVIDADPEAPQPWLVTTFLPGLPLNEAVDQHGPLPPAAVAALGAGLAEALISIHQAGVVHRDLKPHNVMLSPDGPRVIDFGIAHAADISAITRAGAVVGSPGYMSPEQAQGRDTGPAGDVFALGAVLAFAATGTGPFGRGLLEVMVYRVVHDAPDLAGIEEPRLRGLIAACLEKDPARRPTPHQLLQWLATPAPQGTAWLPPPISAGISHHATQVPAHRRISRRALVLGAAGGAALAVGGSAAAAVGLGVFGGSSLADLPRGRLEKKMAAGSPIVAGPVRAGESVIVGTRAGQLIAFDTNTGKERWRHPQEPAKGPFGSLPVVTDSLVVAVSDDGALHVVDLESGAKRVNKPVRASNAPPAIHGDRIFVLTGNTSNQQKSVVVYDLTGTRKETISGVNNAPVIGKDHNSRTHLYLSGSGPVRAFNPTTLQREGSLGYNAGGSLVVDGVVLYGVTGTGNLWAYGLKNSSLLWDAKRPGAAPVAALPRFGYGTIYIADTEGYLYAIDREKWEIEWTFRAGGTISSSPCASGPQLGAESVYVGCNDNHLYAVARMTGTPQWRYPTGGRIGTASPVVVNGVVYVGSQDGSIYGLRAPR